MRQPRHPSRELVVRRLRRAEGHLRAINSMFEAKRSALAIVQQLRAVEVAILHAKRLLVHDQMQHCIDQRDFSGGAVSEIRQLAKFL